MSGGNTVLHFPFAGQSQCLVTDADYKRYWGEVSDLMATKADVNGEVGGVNPNVYARISDVQAALAKEGIAKESRNAQQGYAFRGIDAVMNSLASLLALYKLLILPRVLSRTATERETKQGGVLFSVNVFISAGTAIIGMAKDDGSAFTNETNLTGASGQITYWV